ncbi:hypothetical protein D4S03_11975 [bacterium]|nr:MAG: hypothetical protein D4S03_11975 [bacterium]
MKRLAVLIMALSLLAGCAGVKAFFTQTQTIACAPPAEVIAVAKAAAPLILLAVQMTIPGSATWLAGVDAASAVDSIQKGICISATQLSNLITFLESKNVKMAQAKASKKTTKVAKGLDIGPLVRWQGAVR